MGKICEQFEAETPTDSEATQKARFEVVLDLMQQVRALAICSLLLSAWKFSRGGVLEGCPTAKPRWREGEHKKGDIAWSSGESIETIGSDSSFGLPCCFLGFFPISCFSFLIF